MSATLIEPSPFRGETEADAIEHVIREWGKHVVTLGRETEILARLRRRLLGEPTFTQDDVRLLQDISGHYSHEGHFSARLEEKARDEEDRALFRTNTRALYETADELGDLAKRIEALLPHAPSSPSP